MGLEEEGDQRGTGSGGGMDDHRQSVESWQNQVEHRDSLEFVEGVFWVWVFSLLCRCCQGAQVGPRVRQEVSRGLGGKWRMEKET